MSKAMEEIWKVRKEINEETKYMLPEEHLKYYCQAQKDYFELVQQLHAKKGFKTDAETLTENSSDLQR